MGRPLGRSKSTDHQKAALTADKAPTLVKGYVEIRRRGGKEQLTFQTITGLKKLIVQLELEGIT